MANILALEDDSIASQMLTIIVGQAGKHTLTLVTDTQGALSELGKHREKTKYDLLIADWHLVGENSAKVIQEALSLNLEVVLNSTTSPRDDNELRTLLENNGEITPLKAKNDFSEIKELLNERFGSDQSWQRKR